MAAADVRSIEQGEGKMEQGYADMAALYKGNLESAVASSQAVIEGYQSVGAELLAFLQSRMKEGLELNRRLAGCSSPESALELQVEYAQSSARAYTDELKTLGDLTGKVVADAFAPLKVRAEAVSAKARESVAA